MWALLLPTSTIERESERDHHSHGVQDLHVSMWEDPTGLKTSSWRWTLPCIFPFVVHVPCGSCVFDYLVDVWLDLFLSVSPCDFSSFFPVFIMFFEGTHSNRERSAYTRLAPYHMISWATLITYLESLPPFSSLLLLDFILNSKIPTKNSPQFFLWFVGLMMFCWFWSMDLLGFKWI